ncbi:MAG TPA: acyl-CoA carboxylase subunit epsilon [Marmoricola sp.]
MTGAGNPLNEGMEPSGPSPSLRIINEDATAEEIAAIVAVLSALGGTEAPKPAPRSLWAARQRRTRAALRPGPGAWRASGLPR